MKPIQKVTILIPLYNEKEVFAQLVERIQLVIDQISIQQNITIKVLFVDDGSNDGTSLQIEDYILDNETCSAIFLSRNFGHSSAITAGLMEISNSADAVFLIDGDLQDPPELLSVFLDKMRAGYDVVYGVRKKRKENILKRFCYFLYYRLLKQFSSITMPLDTGDFSLMSKRVVLHLNSMKEESRYVRGLRNWVGFKQIGISYERELRASGKSKYKLKYLLKLAFNGIFNFSEIPIRFIGYVGFIAILLSTIYLFITVYKKLVFGTVPEGFTALIFAIVLFSGVQLLSLAIIGEYVLRIFFQVKERPLFIIKAKIINGKLLDE